MACAKLRSDDVPYSATAIGKAIKWTYFDDQISNNNSRLLPDQLPGDPQRVTASECLGTTGAGVASNGHAAYCDTWLHTIPKLGCTCGFQSQSRPQARSELGAADPLEPKWAPFPPVKKGLVKRRTLRWKRQEWKEGTCTCCGKVTALCNPIKVMSATPDVVLYGNNGNMCSKCLLKSVDAIERVASELRAAQAGGEWSEERMVEEE